MAEVIYDKSKTSSQSTVKLDTGETVRAENVCVVAGGTGGGGGGGAGGNYLPLSGGRLTGLLYINDARFESIGTSLYIGKDNAPKVFHFDLAGGSIQPLADAFGSIGLSNKKWARIYSTKLNNGEDLIVPTEGGTLARVEDITAVVGSISTALTAILGE